MQTDSSRIWIRVTVYFSIDCNQYISKDSSNYSQTFWIMNKMFIFSGLCLNNMELDKSS